MAAKQLIDYINNGNIKNSVNYPKISLGEKVGLRISVLFNADEEYSHEIEGLLNKNGVEIRTLKSASKKGYGAMLIDVESVDEDVLKEIANLESVKKVRLI